MTLPHLEIHSRGTGKDTSVRINGEHQKGITSLSLGVAGNSMVEAHVSFIEPTVDYEGEAVLLTTVDGHTYELIPRVTRGTPAKC